MRTVRQLLESKGSEVFSIGPDAAVIDAIRLMAEKGIGALVVLEPGGRLAGIVSERDYARKIVLEGRSSRDTPVRDIMTADAVTVGLDDDAPACMQLVTERRIRHLPVVVDGKLVGLVSIGDLVKAVIEEQQFELEHLQRYIKSEPAVGHRAP
ncbi:CBS domain-containing protein [Luteimonas granuli]|uniref:CBS domain-containing protein n=1 Tax=Luteimonas granuli TaxID=1176533 RepID=A0A518N2X9_9GAMM|nr:CBS domain-containing protein [Luteimonas granuli]QDW66259.1 CBS domain-containing protein [Luteimonas granuli]